MQSTGTQEDKATSINIDWFKRLDKYHQVFTKTEAEFKAVKETHKSEVLRIDRELAALTEAAPEVICLFRNIIETYNYCEYIRVLDEEKRISNNSSNSSSEKLDKTGLIKNLIKQECGQTDFGIEEIRNMNKQKVEKLKHLSSSEEIVAMEISEAVEESINIQDKAAEAKQETSEKVVDNIKNAVAKVKKPLKEKSDIYSLIWAPKENKENKESKKYKEKKKPKKINLTMWDIPNETRATQVRRCFSYFGKATVLGYMAGGKSKAAYISLVPRDEKKKEVLQSAWSTHFEDRKISRLT